MIVDKVIDRALHTELWIFASLMVLGITIYTIRGYLKMVLLALRLPGPIALPIFGNCLLILNKELFSQKLTKPYQRYGPLFRLWAFIFPFFVLLEPDDLKVILPSKNHMKKAFFYRLCKNVLGDGLITSNGEKWNTHRKLIQPTFHLNILEKYIGTLADSSQAMYKSLDPSVKEINIVKFINNCVYDILNEAILGVPVNKKDTINMADSPLKIGKLTAIQRFIQPWLLLDSIYNMTKMASEEMDQTKRQKDFILKMIKRRREILNSGAENNRKCLLDYMLEISDTNPDFTQEDVINEACTFMFAGQETVAAGMAFSIFLLAQHPDAQEKCIEEIDAIFGDDNRTPTMNDLREMRYLQMCIKETLRLYPSIPLIAREIGEEIQLSKYTLPAGSSVFISPYATHRLPHYFPDPEKFDPERFSPENSESRHPYAYIPFSAGPRYCIANRFAMMEMKTVISRLLRSYTLLPVPGKTKIRDTFHATLRASGGLWIKLKKRRELTELDD